VPAETSSRHDDILEAALRCFSQKGVGATTISDIRAASGASVGSIYHHFGDKDGIAGRVYVEVLRRYHESYLEALQRCRTGEDAVLTTVRHYVGWVLEHREAARMLIEARHSPQVVAAEMTIRAETRTFFEAAHAVFRRFVEAGEIREFPPAVLTSVLVAPCSALAAEWIRAGRVAEAKEQGELLAQAAWRAVRADTTTTKRRTK
jgi:AcrR family transcriptional regulator